MTIHQTTVLVWVEILHKYSLTRYLLSNCPKYVRIIFFHHFHQLKKELQKRQIPYVRRVSINCLKGCPMKRNKKLMNEGRGSYDTKLEKNQNIVPTKWADTKAVTCFLQWLDQNHPKTFKDGQVLKKKFTSVHRPHALSIYNEHMGEVDLLDCFLASYRKRMVSRRWYIYVFWHTMYIGMINA